LALALSRLRSQNPVVLALPRGGVPVGYEIARHLNAPLEAFIVRKVGLPGCADVAMGAVASGGIQVLNGDLVRILNVLPEAVDRAVDHAMRSLAQREARYATPFAPPLLRGCTAILVDDGLAAGFTMQAAVRAARCQQPAGIVVAVPVGASEAVRMVARDADEVVCLRVQEPFLGVGSCYARFGEVSDDDVCELLGRGCDSRRLAS
jgi:putative phosphoribosyl transferase